MKKRMLALLAVLCCVALVAALFVACNNEEEGQTDNTGITTPGDDDAQQGAETPDDEEQGGETPDDEQGGDTQDPADPDEGNEGEEDPDEDIDEPETPDEDIDEPENPSEDEGLAPPTSVEQLFVDPAYQNSEYIIKVESALNVYLKEKIVQKANSHLDINKLADIEWRIEGSETDTSINKIIISFINCASDTSKTIYVRSVIPKIDLTLEDLYDPDETKFNEAFKVALIGGAKYQPIVTFNYDPSIQESSAALTEALKNVAIKDGDLEIEIDESAEFYIVDRGTQLWDELGESRQVELFIKTDNGYQKLTYMIGAPIFDTATLLNEINQGSYRKVLNDKGEFTGHIIDVADNGDADAVGE